MRFTYTYRSSDGRRHSAEIEAESRDDAFARVRRELGVRPIRVTAAVPAEGGRGGGLSPRMGAEGRGGRRPSVLYVIFAAFVLLAAVIGPWLWARRPANAPYRVMTPQGPVTYAVAAPLPRQTIPGDRVRIEAARETAFQSPAERLLARFAEPGRPVGDLGRRERKGRRGTAAASPSPTEEDLRACLREPVRVASTDFTEVVDLKRIVAGIKREMRAYLAAGGTADGYIAELGKRQKLEISYRERAEQKLNEMLRNQDSQPEQSNNPTSKQADNDNLRAAYAYWLKANASLKSMGIHELPLPGPLHGFQAGLGLDE